MSKIKVAQCWDDGVVTDIRLTEILRKNHAKATFNLNPGNHGPVRREPAWQAPGESGWCCRGFMPGKLAAGELTQIYDGFQVASHCWKHETVGTLSDEAFLKAAVDARAYLEDLFQRPCPGFAWPCGVVTDHTADMLLEAGFEYGRTVENTDNVLAYKHPMRLDSSCHFQSGFFFDKYRAAKEGSGVFYFWGHSYEMMDSEGMWRQLEQKIEYISNDPDAEWVDVIDIVRMPRAK